jgi:hypothetical protein
MAGALETGPGGRTKVGYRARTIPGSVAETTERGGKAEGRKGEKQTGGPERPPVHPPFEAVYCWKIT